jgi:hypothetical protein
MNHMILEARKNTERQPFLGLYLHPQNEKAIRLDRRMHFEDFPQKCRNDRAGGRLSEHDPQIGQLR